MDEEVCDEEMSENNVEGNEVTEKNTEENVSDEGSEVSIDIGSDHEEFYRSLFDKSETLIDPDDPINFEEYNPDDSDISSDSQDPSDEDEDEEEEEKDEIEGAEESDEICSACTSSLQTVPYIECDECNAILCFPCFRLGAEVGPHIRGHPYRIVNGFLRKKFRNNWPFPDEKILIETAHAYKLGNWNSLVDASAELAIDKPLKKEQLCRYFDKFFIQGMIGRFGLTEGFWMQYRHDYKKSGILQKALDDTKNENPVIYNLYLAAMRWKKNTFWSPNDDELEDKMKKAALEYMNFPFNTEGRELLGCAKDDYWFGKDLNMPPPVRMDPKYHLRQVREMATWREAESIVVRRSLMLDQIRRENMKDTQPLEQFIVSNREVRPYVESDQSQESQADSKSESEEDAPCSSRALRVANRRRRAKTIKSKEFTPEEQSGEKIAAMLNLVVKKIKVGNTYTYAVGHTILNEKELAELEEQERKSREEETVKQQKKGEKEEQKDEYDAGTEADEDESDDEGSPPAKRVSRSMSKSSGSTSWNSKRSETKSRDSKGSKSSSSTASHSSETRSNASKSSETQSISSKSSDSRIVTRGRRSRGCKISKTIMPPHKKTPLVDSSDDEYKTPSEETPVKNEKKPSDDNMTDDEPVISLRRSSRRNTDERPEEKETLSFMENVLTKEEQQRLLPRLSIRIRKPLLRRPFSPKLVRDESIEPEEVYESPREYNSDEERQRKEEKMGSDEVEEKRREEVQQPSSPEEEPKREPIKLIIRRSKLPHQPAISVTTSPSTSSQPVVATEDTTESVTEEPVRVEKRAKKHRKKRKPQKSKKLRRLEGYHKREKAKVQARKKLIDECGLINLENYRWLRRLRPNLALAHREPPYRKNNKLRSDDLALLAYNPRRHDFEMEEFNDAETMISNMEIAPLNNLNRTLKIQQIIKFIQIHQFNRAMQVRVARKNAVAHHDLITKIMDQFRAMTVEKRNFTTIMESSPMDEKLLRRTTQSLTKDEYNNFEEKWEEFMELKERIETLQKLQDQGVFTLKGIDLTSSRKKEKELKLKKNAETMKKAETRFKAIQRQHMRMYAGEE